MFFTNLMAKMVIILMLLTWQHSEYGSKGVELEPVDDVADVTHFYGHKDASGGQQENVEALCNYAQPQHTCENSLL